MEYARPTPLGPRAQSNKSDRSAVASRTVGISKKIVTFPETQTGIERAEIETDEEYDPQEMFDAFFLEWTIAATIVYREALREEEEKTWK